MAKKLGLEEAVTENMSTEDMRKSVFDYQGIEKFISWEEFREKGYYLYDVAEDWEDDPPGLRQFYEDPENHKVPTPSGKLEFYSEKLAKHYDYIRLVPHAK